MNAIAAQTAMPITVLSDRPEDDAASSSDDATCEQEGPLHPDAQVHVLGPVQVPCPLTHAGDVHNGVEHEEPLHPDAHVHVSGAEHTWFALQVTAEQMGVEHVAPPHPFGTQSHPGDVTLLHKPPLVHDASHTALKTSSSPNTVVGA